MRLDQLTQSAKLDFAHGDQTESSFKSKLREERKRQRIASNPPKGEGANAERGATANPANKERCGGTPPYGSYDG